MYLKSLEILNFRKFYYGLNCKENFKNSISNSASFSFVQAGTTSEINERTTLVVGQNNTGKTTLAKFLEIVSNLEPLKLSDINNKYLAEIVNLIIEIKEKGDITPKNLPIVGGILHIDIADERDDLIHNLQGFLNLKNNDFVKIKVIWEIEEQIQVLEKINNLTFEEEQVAKLKTKIKSILSESLFKINFYNENNDSVKVSKKNHFLDFKFIRANNVAGDNVLSDSFNKIINDYSSLRKEEIIEEINKINKAIKKNVIKESNKNINKKLVAGNVHNHIKIKLTPDLTLIKILSSANIKYNYVENGHLIDEDKFGLGYTRLILILSEILDYVNKYDNNKLDLRVNIIYIEEPEAFMHPQLQRIFMTNLSDLVKEFLKINGDESKDLNSQLVVSTHSDHILNSKIEKANSFNNINYLYFEDNEVRVKELKDEDVSDKSTLEFIIKHLKNNMEELFFNDAVILVEGVTEYHYIKTLLEKNEELSSKFISVYIVGGAYAQVYIKLIDFLNIPTAIITDIDLKNDKSDNEISKSKNIKIEDIEDYITTNTSFNEIKKHNYFKNKEAKEKNYKKISKIVDVFKYINNQPDNNYKIFTQTNKHYNKYLPTSFEESLILDNCKPLEDETEYNSIQKVLMEIFPRSYKKFINNVEENSRNIQSKLNSNNYKTIFIKNILEGMIINNYKITSPKYIDEALSFIETKLKGENDEK